MDRDSHRLGRPALRRVNIQGSFFGQTVAIRLGLSESDIEALEVLIDSGAATAGRLAELMGLTTGAVTRVVDRLERPATSGASPIRPTAGGSSSRSSRRRSPASRR